MFMKWPFSYSLIPPSQQGFLVVVLVIGITSNHLQLLDMYRLYHGKVWYMRLCNPRVCGFPRGEAK